MFRRPSASRPAARACRRPRGRGGRRRRSARARGRSRQGMCTAPGTTSRFSVPRSCAACGHLAGQLQPACALRRVVARSAGTARTGTSTAPLMAMPISSAVAADRAGIPSARPSATGRCRGRSSARCRRSPASFASCRHCSSVIRSRVGERPEVDRLLHVVPLARDGRSRARFLRGHRRRCQEGGARQQR